MRSADDVSKDGKTMSQPRKTGQPHRGWKGAARERLKRSPMSAWKKIRTAPLDERVLVFDAEWEMTIGSIQIGIRYGGSNKWTVPDIPDGEFHPTHWMPLPEEAVR